MSRPRWAAALTTACVLVGLMGWTARPPEDGVVWRGLFVAVYATMFWGVWSLLKVARPDWRTVLVGAVVLRVVAFPMLPSLSDDGYRYVWDGVILVEAGTSPYAHTPSSTALEEWRREPVFPLLNSPDYYTVYPPVSQAVFAVGASLYSQGGWAASWWTIKFLLVLAEVGGLVAALRVFAPHQVALYAWSPLAITEIAGQGHVEGLIVGVLGVVLATRSIRLPVRSIATALGAGVKLYPVALLPMAWRRDGWTGVVASVALFGAMAAAVAWQNGAPHALESLALFMGTLDWFSAPYLALKLLAYPALGEGSGAVAAGVLAAGAALVVGWAALSDDGTVRSLRLGTAVVVVAVTLCAPTFHPWYLVPALFVAPALGAPRWLVWLCASTSVTYLAYVVGTEWRPLILAVVWAPAVAFALGDRRPWGDLPE